MIRLSKRLETVVSLAGRKPGSSGAELRDVPEEAGVGQMEPGDAPGGSGAIQVEPGDAPGGSGAGWAESGEVPVGAGVGRTESGEEPGGVDVGRAESGEEPGGADVGRAEPKGAGETSGDEGREFAFYRIADVGTDHGYVPVALALRNPAVMAIAMDVRPGPLERAREHIAEYGLEARIETRLGDGVEKLEAGEADTVVIAGMGGELVIHILEGGRRLWDCVERWILSPQSELDKVRLYLVGHGFAITDEVMVEEDGKYYTVMEVRHPDSREEGQEREYPARSREGTDPGRREAESTVGKGSKERQRETMSAAAVEDHILKQAGYLYGSRLIEKKDPVLLEFLEKEERLLTEIIGRLEGRDSPKTVARREELIKKRTVARRALEEIKGSDSLSVNGESAIGLPLPRE